MTQAIHYYIPAIGNKGNNYIEFRCGRTVHQLKEKYLLTQDQEKVTCIKCKSYINNPLRVLRRYGRITVIEGFSIVLNHDFGYKHDLILMFIKPGVFNLCVGINSTLIYIIEFQGDFCTMPGRLVRFYEANLLPDNRIRQLTEKTDNQP
jgi:hypothetical protein